jgi:flagellar hook-associated protein 1 FlgK
MSFGFGLGAGLRALEAARHGMQTAGNNVANANTPGYSRQRVLLAEAMPFMVARGFQIGSGVAVAGINRLVDEGLERRLRLQLGLVGAAEVDFARFDELQGILGEPDTGMSQALGELFGRIGSLRTDPADPALRGGVVQAGNDVAQGFRLMSRRLGELGESSFDEVRGLVREVNERAHAIAEINAQIAGLEANGSSANDLRDMREQHVKEISRLIDVRALERNSGSLDLLVGGHLLVGGDRVSELGVGKTGDGKTQVLAGRGTSPLAAGEGRIAALLRQESIDLTGYGERIDRLARNLIREVNRLHSTGMPATGPFARLIAGHGAADGNQNGQRGDELLSQAGLPFDVQGGELFVNVTDRATGAVERTRIAIDPQSMTLQDLAAAIDAVDHLAASVDPTGRLRIDADSGHGFDFSPRLDPNPDGFGSFGGSAPSIGSQGRGPFDFSAQAFPISLMVTTGTAAAPVNTPVTLQANEFVDPAAVTVDELVTAINQDLGSAATARNVGGHLVVRSNEAGAAAQLQLSNIGPSTALAAMGMSTATATGQATGVAVHAEGTWNGTGNDQFVFVPTIDGTVGVTPNLRVQVMDRAGNQVATVDVGAGYTPGTPIDLGNGVRVDFGPGQLSATAGSVFALDVLADSDTADVLVALGINAFFLGSTAADIAVDPDLLANPDRLAAGLSVATGDAGTHARFMGLRATDLGDLDANTIEDFYAELVGDVGFEAAGAEQTLNGQDALLAHLQAERDSISGVNLDEEMIDLTRFQQSYEAAARFISTVQEMTAMLMSILR